MSLKSRKNGVRTNLWLDEAARKRLDILSKKMHTSLSGCMENLIEAEYNQTINSNNVEGNGNINVGNNTTTRNIHVGALSLDQFADIIKQQFVDMDEIREQQLQLLRVYELNKSNRSKIKLKKPFPPRPKKKATPAVKERKYLQKMTQAERKAIIDVSEKSL